MTQITKKVVLETRSIPSELTYEIRKKVLWPHITNGDYSILIDNNPNTFHLGTYYKHKIISIGTFVKEQNLKFNCNSQYRLRAMATDENYRKIGAGKNLFLTGIKMLKSRNIQLLWCDARLIAIPFYKSVNMNSVPGIYNIPNIGEHQTMYIYLNCKK